MAKSKEMEELAMTYEQIKCFKPSSFKRKCGIQRQTFEQMVEVLYPRFSSLIILAGLFTARLLDTTPRSTVKPANIIRGHTGYPELDRTGKRGGQCKLSVEDQLLLVLE